MAGSRRAFLKKAAAIAAAGTMKHAVLGQTESGRPRTSVAGSGTGGKAAVEVREGRLHIETGTLTAVIDKGLMTSTAGMKKLIDQVASLGSGLVVGGENLNEITAQGQSFAQAHLFRSWQSSIEGLERTGGCPLNEFLLGRLCRTLGHSSLGGRNADEQPRMRIHEEHGAIPTITLRSAREIADPNPAVKRILDQAAGF